MSEQGAGLCGSCQHARRIRSRRGSVFLLCERSRTDPAYPRYPRLPVLACAGYDRIDSPPREPAPDEEPTD
ncbi:MAG: hypothetical protein ACRELV_12005 [Longimicrobiales bacterium]